MRWRRGALALLGLAVLGSVSLPAGATAPPMPVEVNHDAEEARSHVAPALAANPHNDDHLVAVDVKRTGTDVTFGTCVAHVSLDGGATWTGTSLPTPEGFQCRKVYPHVTFFGSDVLALYFAQPPGGGAGRLVLARSGDGGNSFAAAARIPLTPVEEAGATFPQGITLAGDRSKNEVYVAWNLNQFPMRIMFFSRSTDGGTTFSTPSPVMIPVRAMIDKIGPRFYPPTIAVGGGRIYVAGIWWSCESWIDQVTTGCFNFSLTLTTSDDGGLTFSDPRILDTFPLGDFDGGLWPRVSMAVDQARPNRVYIAYEDGSRGPIGLDAVVLRSADSGATWQGPVRTADAVYDAGFPHQRPALSIAPNGRIDVAWYDGRHDPRSPGTICPPEEGPMCPGRDIYYAYSLDAGATFERNVRVTPETFSSMSRAMYPKPQIETIGTLGIVSTDGEARMVWEQRTGAARIGERDVPVWDLRASRARPSDS